MRDNRFDTNRLDQLFNRLQAGDGDARGELISHVQTVFRGFAKRLLGNQGADRWADVDDVVQEAAIILNGKLDEFHFCGSKAFYVYVAKSIRLATNDLARRCRRLIAKYKSGTPRTDKGGHADLDPADRSTERCEQMIALNEILAALPEPERTAVIFVKVMEMTYQEAAEKLGTNQTAVIRALTRARLMIGQRLKQADDMESDPTERTR